jgi:hypothetical protein
VPLRNYWAETQPNYFNEDLDYNGDSTTHVDEYAVEIPNAAHIKKLVCSAGTSIRGTFFGDIERVGYPMSWVHVIEMHEPSSDLYPSGRYVTLNKQAGSLVTTQVSQDQQVVVFSAETHVVNSRSVTWYSGHIQPIDQGMSYGSVDQSIGERTITARLYIHGVHGTSGNPFAATPLYKYSCSMVLRVLYERMVGGGGGG